MARTTDPERYELSETEKRDLIQADKPLPEKYRFLLFEDKRRTALAACGRSQCIPILSLRGRNFGG